MSSNASVPAPTYLPSTQEEIAIAELRPLISDLISEDPKLTDDLFLLQWLKHSNFKINRTEKGIRESFEWKKENNIEALLNGPLVENKHIRFGIDSKTKDGTPAAFIYVNELFKMEKEQFYESAHQALAKLEKIILDYNRQKYAELCDKEQRRVPLVAAMVTGGYGVIDIKRFGFNDLRHPGALQMGYDVARVSVNYFPGLGRHLCYINMNRLFEVIFKLLKPIISIPTMELTAYDCRKEKWRPALLQFFTEEELYRNLEK